MKKYLKKIFLLLILTLPIFSNIFVFWNWDILSDVFDPVNQRGSIIYIWNSKDDVWHSVLREGTSYSRWTWFYQKAPLLVKFVKIILRITVVLSITMIIFYSIKFMLQVFGWSELKSATAKKDLINVLIWLLIAMFSITAITLVTSLAKSTFKSNDFWFINWWSYWDLKYNKLTKNLI